MNNGIFFVIALASLFVLFGCEKDSDSPVHEGQADISFQIERTQSEDNYLSSVAKVISQKITTSWSERHANYLQLIREITMELELEDGRTIEFGIWMLKREADTEHIERTDLAAGEEGVLWDYRSSEVEAERFYRGFDEARILINQNNVMFVEPGHADFRISKVEPTTVDGRTVSELTIEFEGRAYGWYDPQGERQEIYEIAGGSFQGFLE